MERRVIIIGSGLGGLECGYILAKHGMKVIVLEQDAQIGGCLQTFRRRASDGSMHTFDTGFHYVGGLGEGQSLYPLFKYFGLLELPWQQLDPECFDEVFFTGGEPSCAVVQDALVMRGGTSELSGNISRGQASLGYRTDSVYGDRASAGYPFASGHDQFVECLAEYFPHQRENLRRYAAFLKSVGDNIFKAFEPDNEMNSLFGRSAYDFLNEMITDPMLRKVLCGTSLKLELNRATLPLYEFAQINNSFIQSAWRLGTSEMRDGLTQRQVAEKESVQVAEVKDGVQGQAEAMSGSHCPQVRAVKVSGGALIAKKLADAIISIGGEVRTNAKVVKINVNDDGAVSGVTVVEAASAGNHVSERHDASDGNVLPASGDNSCGEFIPADWVVSDAHPAVTVGLIEECKAVRKIYRHRIGGLRNTYGMFTANLILKPGALPYMNRNLFIHSENADLWSPDPVKTDSVMVHFCPESTSVAQSRGHTCIDLLSPMDWGGIEQWVQGHVGRRGEAYEEVKQRKLEECIALADSVLRRYSGKPLRDIIDTAYTSTPLTWRSYTSTPCGSAYGIAKDWTNPMATVLSPRTPLPNLLMTGQSLNLHGILGVSMTSVITCASILGQEIVHELLSDI